jgi:hypothetical protein
MDMNKSWDVDIRDIRDNVVANLNMNEEMPTNMKYVVRQALHMFNIVDQLLLHCTGIWDNETGKGQVIMDITSKESEQPPAEPDGGNLTDEKSAEEQLKEEDSASPEEEQY